MIAGLTLLVVIISSAIAILVYSVLGIPVGSVPLIGGLASFGAGIFGGIWWVAEILANLMLVLLTVVVMLLFFTGRLDNLLP